MRKILMLAKREYLAAVKTKGFIITLIVVPIMMSGSGLGMALLKDRVNTDDLAVAVIDHSNLVMPVLEAAANRRNAESIFDPESGKKVKPAYLFEAVEPDPADPRGQQLALSQRVRSGELHAFLVVGRDVLQPGDDPQQTRLSYHAENPALDELRRWVGNPINNFLRRSRAEAAGVQDEELEQLFGWIRVDGLSLLTVDEDTGQVDDARTTNEAQAILIPLVLVMLMFMMVLMSALPLLGSVQEEKNQRIAEVMLGSVRPFQFMMGKVLGGVGISLTGVSLYVVGGLITVNRLGAEDYVPYDILPWFFAFLILAIFMLGATYAALGAACNDAKEAQSLTFPAMLPVMIPMFVMMPILENPDTGFATWLSLFPPCTPMLMTLRMAVPVSIPAWQPWVGLGLVALSAVLAIWAGGRLFRVAILMQGTPPKPANLIRWIIKG